MSTRMSRYIDLNIGEFLTDLLSEDVVNNLEFYTKTMDYLSKDIFSEDYEVIKEEFVEILKELGDIKESIPIDILNENFCNILEEYRKNGDKSRIIETDTHIRIDISEVPKMGGNRIYLWRNLTKLEIEQLEANKTKKDKISHSMNLIKKDFVYKFADLIVLKKYINNTNTLKLTNNVEFITELEEMIKDVPKDEDLLEKMSIILERKKYIRKYRQYLSKNFEIVGKC